MKQCPNCEGQNSNNAAKCYYCGANIKNISALKQPPEQGNKFGLVLIFFLIFSGIVYFNTQKTNNRSTHNISGPSSNSSSSSGKTVSLFMDGEPILCGTTEGNIKDAIDAIVDGDSYGFNEMFLTGKLFEVTSRTNALILDVNFSTVKVRIQEGTFKNQICWTVIEAAN